MDAVGDQEPVKAAAAAAAVAAVIAVSGEATPACPLPPAVGGPSVISNVNWKWQDTAPQAAGGGGKGRALPDDGISPLPVRCAWLTWLNPRVLLAFTT